MTDAPLSGTTVGAPDGTDDGSDDGSDDLVGGLLRRIHDRTARVLIVGQGYVGLPVSMRAVEVGFDVVGLEASPERAAALKAGSSYVADVTDDQLRRALDAGYRAVDDPAETGPFDVAVITVPTPLRDGAPDLSYVEDAAHRPGQRPVGLRQHAQGRVRHRRALAPLRRGVLRRAGRQGRPRVLDR